MKSSLTEDEIEQYQLQLLQTLGYSYCNGYDIQPTDSRFTHRRVRHWCQLIVCPDDLKSRGTEEGKEDK